MMVKRTITALALLGVFATAGAVPAAGQAQWDELDVEGGKEFRLANEAGDVILLQCLVRGVGAAIQLAEPIDSARRVTMRGIPGERRNIAVRLAGGYFLSIASGSGRDFLFRMLRNAAGLSVRVSGQEFSFDVFGSDAIVSQCLQQQEGAPQD